ncbi:amidohydrolase family protein [Variovorax sp. JS1663]|uniref:amidohydrolase family protein n=1 Tax=Variovorax sp. JS1663 TaxID=1851577 RepID=UPI000B348DC6|nr:amidohydrolase family protein [Variovorax sp. JS1663]OUM00198.1 amidohydrolase [Variovorax sp. JS1663]
MSALTTTRRGVPPQHWVDDAWLALRTEVVLEPTRPIVDPHHHLWQRPHSTYLLPQLLEDLGAGHDVRGTVFVECTSMYRAEGDPRFAPLGEVEFANGVAAASASGYYGPVRACAGIVGTVDLLQGASAREVLEACRSHAPERFRGIRHRSAWDADHEVHAIPGKATPGLLRDERFRAGFAQLAPLGLSFDAWCFHPQLPELIELVDAFPDTRVIVNHVGGLAGVGPYRARRDEAFAQWKVAMQALARRPNVFVKLGGMGMRLSGFDFFDRDLPPTSEELAQAWRPAVETCIEAFGARRAMFESNFPVDKACCSYRVLWNAFKRLAASCSEDEKAQLFAGTAIRAYRLPEALGRPAA